MTAKLLTGDCREILKTIAADSIDCAVTSPPYFGLRDYGTGVWQGGDATCQHLHKSGGTNASTLGLASGGNDMSDAARVRSTERSFVPYTSICGKCGAIRTDSQIGLESSPQKYVAEMVAVFREVRRVLKKTGTLWLNLGDSYARNPAKGQHKPGDSGKQGYIYDNGNGRASSTCLIGGLKEKDLIGIPWRVAFALQDDGWYLRQDIIWSKPNPMPESVTDRCTKAHEYLFLLAKSPRYFFDADAIREPAVCDRLPGRGMTDTRDTYGAGNGGNSGLKALRNRLVDTQTPDTTRNKRSVWEVPTAPYAEAHFATFPPKLIEPCILAGCPKGGTVLDPFGGAGTTALVADRLGRNAILIELNPAYAEMARRRLVQDAGMFAQVAAE